jgi:bud site selection protein 20
MFGSGFVMCCSRYFTSDQVLMEHVTSKIHKKRVKLANEKPYSQAEANAAAGMASAKHD